VKAYLIKVGKGESFPEDKFAALFKELDLDGNLIISKKEMKELIQNIME
jgi:Ca2+-binding EF-hand superfamily protein